MKPLMPLAAVLLACASPVLAQEGLAPGGAPVVAPAPKPMPVPEDMMTPDTGTTVPESGSTGIPADQAAHLGSGAVIARIDPQTSLLDRRESGQRSIELLQTTLLNTLGALGFGETQDVRKDGERYIARTRAPSGDWITVELNPMTGTITRLN